MLWRKGYDHAKFGLYGLLLQTSSYAAARDASHRDLSGNLASAGRMISFSIQVGKKDIMAGLTTTSFRPGKYPSVELANL